MDDRPDDLIVVPDLTICIARLFRLLKSFDLPAGLSVERLSILYTLEQHGSMSLTELAEFERLRPASTSRLVSALVESKLVTRRDNKQDARGIIVSISAMGRRLSARALKRQCEEFGPMLRMLDTKECVVIKEAMDTLLRSLSKVGQNDQPLR